MKLLDLSRKSKPLTRACDLLDFVINVIDEYGISLLMAVVTYVVPFTSRSGVAQGFCQLPSKI